MATASAKKNAEQEVQAVEERPTRADIFNAALVVARSTNRVPTLHGPTGSGKTHGLHMLASERGAEVVTVLTSQHTPDEVAGFQLAINDRLEIQMPYWFREAQNILDNGKSVWLLFDELGLAREEVRGALYTFFRDRHLHGRRLVVPEGKEALVFAATNPAVFAPPYRSRCLFLNVPSDPDYLLSIAGGSSFTKRVISLAPYHDESDPYYSNAEPPSPQVLDASSVATLKLLTDNLDFWHLTRPAQYAVLAGLVPHQALEAALRDLTIDSSKLATDPEALSRALNALPKDKAIALINDVLVAMPRITKEQRVEALMVFFDYLYSDESGSALVTYFSTPRPAEVMDAVVEIDAPHMVKRLKEEGLLWVEEQGNERAAKGTLVDRLERMIELGSARDEDKK